MKEMNMDQEQMQMLVQKVSEMLAQGAQPEQVLQQLVQQGLPQEAAVQIIQAAMQMAGGQQGGEGMQGTMNTERESQNMIETALQELGPEVMYALLQAYDRLTPENKSALIQQLSQMAANASSEGQGQTMEQGQEGAEAKVQESNMFGAY